jgi:hypothetical protein
MANPVNRMSEAETCTIASGASLSGAVNLGGRIPVGVYMPASWTAAALTFQVSPDGVTYYNAHTEAAEYSVTASAVIYVNFDSVNFYGANFLKVRSGTSGTPVNQGADRVMTLMLGQPDVN